jgi:hypothetical protein
MLTRNKSKAIGNVLFADKITSDERRAKIRRVVPVLPHLLVAAGEFPRPMLDVFGNNLTAWLVDAGSEQKPKLANDPSSPRYHRTEYITETYGLYVAPKPDGQGDLRVCSLKITDGVRIQGAPDPILSPGELESLDDQFRSSPEGAASVARHYHSRAIAALLERFVYAYDIGEAVIQAVSANEQH